MVVTSSPAASTKLPSHGCSSCTSTAAGRPLGGAAARRTGHKSR